MSQPPPYTPVHSFVSDSIILANFPGQDLDVEFRNVKTTTDAIRANMAVIQRDDGSLANGSVGFDQLSPSLQTNGLAPANGWATATAYTVGTSVIQIGNLYRCIVSHTSGVFATDLAAAKWLLVAALGSNLSFLNISGTAAISQGGTGQVTAGAAFDALAPTTLRGDIIYRNATTNTRLAAGTSGFVLQTNGAGADPTWVNILASPAFIGTPTAPTPAANDSSTRIATTAYVDAADALIAPTTTRGDMIFRNATTNTRLPAGTSGYHLQTSGAGADPAWVGFTQSGGGAVTRTWQDKARGIVSVKDFGAVGDGTTNDTAAFQAAGAAFKHLQVPSGAYLLSSTPSLSGVLIETTPDSSLTGAGGVALGYTGNSNRQTIHSGTSGTDFATRYIRRNASHTGGTAGSVSSGFRTDTYVSAGATNYEWAIVGVVDNSATAGQNVGGYFQGIRRSTGPTWGAVAEVIDFNGANPTTGTIGLEVDVTGNGTDTSNNRIGVDIVVRKRDSAGAVCVASYGVKLQNGGDASSFSVGFDTSSVTIGQAAFKMAQNQSIAFDASATNQLAFDGTGLAYSVSGTKKSRLNADGGIALNGLRTVLSGTFSTGAVTPTLGGALKPGVSNQIAQWLSLTIDGSQFWIPVWAA